MCWFYAVRTEWHCATLVKLGFVILAMLATADLVHAGASAKVYNIPAPSNVDQPFIRIYNPTNASGAVRATLYDQNGGLLGTAGGVLIPALAANSVQVLTSSDIANTLGATTWPGRAWMKLDADFSDIRVLNLIRSSLLLSMSCLDSERAYYIPSPSSTTVQAYIRLYNGSSTAGAVRGTLYDESGAILGTPNATLVASLGANAVTVLNGSDLAGIFGVSTWTGSAWMSVSSDFLGLRVMNTLRDLTTNLLTDVSCGVETVDNLSNVLNVPPPASTTSALVRIYNTSVSPLTVKGTLYAESGAVIGTANVVLGTLAAKSVLSLSNADIANKVGANSWTGRAWMQVSANSTGLKVLALTKQRTLMEMSCAEDEYAMNIPDASNGQDHPYIRIYNTGTAATSVTGTLYDQNGNVLGTANTLLVSAMAAKSVTVLTASALAGMVGVPSWAGRAWLKLSSSAGKIQILDILEDQSTGNWANMSCTTLGGSTAKAVAKSGGDSPNGVESPLGCGTVKVCDATNVIMPRIFYNIAPTAMGTTYWLTLEEEFQLGPSVFVPIDELRDPDNQIPATLALVNNAVEALRKMIARLWAAKTYPTFKLIGNVLNSAVAAGVAAQSPDVAVSTASAEFIKWGFPAAAGTGAGGLSGTVASSATQIAAGKACAAAAYNNPTTTKFDPQVDSHCKLAQFDACLHRAGITTYDQEGRDNCAVAAEMAKLPPGGWSCSYCPYPY